MGGDNNFEPLLRKCTSGESRGPESVDYGSDRMDRCRFGIDVSRWKRRGLASSLHFGINFPMARGAKPLISVAVNEMYMF